MQVEELSLFIRGTLSYLCSTEHLASNKPDAARVREIDPYIRRGFKCRFTRAQVEHRPVSVQCRI